MFRIVVAISGATGAIYGIKFLEEAKKAGIETQLIIIDSAKRTIQLETNYQLEDIQKLAGREFSIMI